MQKTQTTCLVILATIATGFSLAYLKTVLLPFVIAFFIVIGCRPILEFVEKKLKLHRLLAFVVTFLAGVALLLGFAFLIWLSINDLSRNSDAYQERLNRIAVWVVEHLPDALESEVEQPPTARESSPDADNQEIATVAKDPAKAVQEFLTFASNHVQTQMLGLAGSLSSLFSYGVLILIFVFFLLLGNSQLGNPIADRGVESSTPSAPSGIVGEIEEQVRKYLVMKTVISIVTGFVFGLVLWLFGVPLAIVFGFLAFLLNYIPNIGPLISTALPVPFLVLNSAMSPTTAIVCFALIATIQFVSGNVIETRLMGKSFDVSPAFLLLALMFFGLIWGIAGMFLATPIVSIIKIVLQQSRGGRPIAELMAGRWSGLNFDAT